MGTRHGSGARGPATKAVDGRRSELAADKIPLAKSALHPEDGVGYGYPTDKEEPPLIARRGLRPDHDMIRNAPGRMQARGATS